MAKDRETLYSAEKELALEPAWYDRDGEVLEIVCPLQVDGVVVEGLQFRMTARKRLPDRAVTVQLEYHPGDERGGPLTRIEWKPLQGHTNRGRGPKEHQYKLLDGCHYHPFDLNWKHAQKEMLEDSKIPVAIPLSESPKDFDELAQFVKKEFRIMNIEWIEVPPWEPTFV